MPPPIQASYLARVAVNPPNGLTTLSVTLNGEQLFALSDFAGGVTSVDRVVTLLASNTIALSVAGAKGTRITITVFTVAMPQPVALEPDPLALNLGATGTLTATLSPEPTAPGTLELASSDAAVVSVPASVDFGPGQASVAIPVSALGSGSALVTASANGGQASATVRVNAPPTVSLTSPAPGATFTAPATVLLAATAADSDGSVARVDFFQGSILIGSAVAPPYAFSWTDVTQGSYTLRARATDNDGAMTTSAGVNIIVNSGVKQVYYIVPDHLNTPRLIQDQAGNAVWRNDNTEPFGDSVPNDNPSGLGAFEFPLRLSNYYADKETGMQYAMLRDCYDPISGRFCESDPIGIRGGINTYAYATSTPIGTSDPLGLAPNGCGAATGLSKYLPNYLFKDCCDNHDNCYDDCENKPTKYECDQDFVNCMRDKCKGSGFVAFCQKVASGYWFGVGGYGRGYFNNARAKCPICK